MKHLILMLLLVFCLCSCTKENEKASPQPVQSDKVIVTQFGEGYHKEGCEYLNRPGAHKSMEAMEAEDMGYRACEVCRP